MSKTFTKKNPRFVWNIGSIAEVFPDMPEQTGGDLILWDRQEKKPAVVVPAEYAQAMCLETTTTPADAPFTNLENWLNSLKRHEMASENLKPTH